MTQTTEVKVQPNVFGNITRPGHSGILGLPLGVSLMGVPFIVIIVLLMVAQNFLLAVVFTLLGVVAAILVVATKKEGRTIYGRVVLRQMHRRREKQGKNVYISGPAGYTRDGAVRLPGLLASSELADYNDSYGGTFGVLRMSGQGVKNYSVVLEAFSEGDELVSRERVNSMVAHWGAWLAQRGVDEGIAGASVSVESAPDTGLRLKRLMERNRSADGSSFSHDVGDAIQAEYSGGAPAITTRITVTFDGKAIDSGKDRGMQEMAAEISNRLPIIIAGLHDTGAGTTVRACTAQDIVDHTRSAYDPTVATEIEAARATPEGTGLRWEDAGPSFARAGFDTYQHDRAWSKTWTMYEGPRGMFYSTALRRALEPMADVLRKRVTILYRPIPAGETTSVAERGIKDSTFAGSQKRGISPAARQKQAAAIKSAEEEAQGAGFTRFGIVVTVSVDDPERFHRLKQQVPAQFNGARLRLREALANEDVAFQAGLPLGMVLPDHMLLPSEIGDFF